MSLTVYFVVATNVVMSDGGSMHGLFKGDFDKYDTTAHGSLYNNRTYLIYTY